MSDFPKVDEQRSQVLHNMLYLGSSLGLTGMHLAFSKCSGVKLQLLGLRVFTDAIEVDELGG